MRKYVARKDAVEVRAANNSDFVVRIYPDGMVQVESFLRESAITIRDIDFAGGKNTKELSPEGTTYEITSYHPQEDRLGVMLNADVAAVYVGSRGIILDRAARDRVRKLPTDRPKYRHEN